MIKITSNGTSVIDYCESHEFSKAVIAYVRAWSNEYKGEGVTFDMLERAFAQYFRTRGDETIDLPRTQNIVVWVGCSKDFKEIVLDAIQSLEIHGAACEMEHYTRATNRMQSYLLAQPSDFKKRPSKTKWQPLWLLPGSGVANLDSQMAN